MKKYASIILIFQPSHSPESNPIEQVWQYLKQGLRWQLPANLDEWRLLIRQQLERMSKEVIVSIRGRAYIIDALFAVKV